MAFPIIFKRVWGDPQREKQEKKPVRFDEMFPEFAKECASRKCPPLLTELKSEDIK